MRTSFPLHSPDFYTGDPYPAYRELRVTSPVCWNDVTNFGALLKYEDIRFVSSSPAVFSSNRGITDPPRHRQLRKLINSGFTRRQVTILEPRIREIVRRILDRVDAAMDRAGGQGR